MNRRDFVAAATLAAASPLAWGRDVVKPVKPGAAQPQPKPEAAPTPPAPAIPKRTLRKAVMYGMIGEGSTTQERFQVLRDTGFDGVEMDSPTKIPIDEIAAAASKTGIVVHGLVDSVHWAAPLNHPESSIRARGIEALKTCLQDAKTLGCTSILLVPAVVNKDLPYDEAWTRSQEAIREVLPMARESGVQIGIENVWNNFIMSPLEATRYVDELNTPATTRRGTVGWHFDIGNVINYGWPDQWAKVLGHRICKLHIKDFSKAKRDKEGLWKGFDVELGDGDAGWPGVMAALDKVGYSTQEAELARWATAEVHGGDRKRLAQIAGQMDKLFAS